MEIFTKSTEENNESKPQNEPECDVLKENPVVVNTNERLFNVVWGKKSTRKHKKWEGDGTLLVLPRSAVLKDEDGKVIGRISNVNTDGYVEGHILS